jgi:uncharacterized membrane protein
MKKFDVASAALLLLMLGASAALYAKLPEQMATHWDAAGNVNGYQSRFFASLFCPAIAVAIWLKARVFAPWFTRRRSSLAANNSASSMLPSTLPVMSTLALFTLGIVHAQLLAAGLGYHVDAPRIGAALLAVTAFVIGCVMPRTRQNPFVGIRNYWTYMSQEVWAKTHRIAGYAYFGAGVLMVPTLLIGGAPAFYTALTLFCLATASAFASSLYFARTLKA